MSNFLCWGKYNDDDDYDDDDCSVWVYFVMSHLNCSLKGQLALILLLIFDQDLDWLRIS